ncbi:MAG: helix-turn-helix domain-containing protein [Candidatus Melainabacteria bacterium]|nr:helix-turn-helix domain-containing protein [Candidatus Melainabacteria bacterium]
MSEPAQEIKFDPSSVEGMDDLLSGPDLAPPGSDKSGPGLLSPDLAHWWTLPEATTALGVNERTLRRWIKRDKIEARKVQGTYGEEWRIKPGSPTDCPPVTTGPDKSDPAPARPATPDSPVLVPDLLETKIRLALMEQENQQLKQQLQGATYRNGYLESKLEERDNAIKLLTDSQHKRNGWSRFWSWFSGR